MAVTIPASDQIPLVCQALKAGCHAMCEVPVCMKLAHCWQLVTTVERTRRTFMLMEQIRFSGIAREWHRIVQDGVIGKTVFAEGEYFEHKIDCWFQDERGVFYSPDQARDVPDAKPTWRYELPPICYLPHELSPLLYVLQDRVIRVVGIWALARRATGSTIYNSRTCKLP